MPCARLRGGALVKATVLLIEDDARLGPTLARALEEEGFVVELIDDGAAGLARLALPGIDVAVVDGMLPGMDGFELVRAARAQGVGTPALLVTARDAVKDRVVGLDTGADDYLVKPFSFDELVARLRAVLRRGRLVSSPILRWRNITLDVERHEVTRGDVLVAVSAKEFAILELLMRLRGAVATRQMILEGPLGYRIDPGTNVIDVHVLHLRRKLDDPASPSLIETVRGVGYRLSDA